MSKPDLFSVRWRKSSYSGDTGGDCLELAALRRKSSSASSGVKRVALAGGPRDVAVRDSKDPDGPKLVFESAAFSAFARRVKTGELDLA